MPTWVGDLWTDGVPRRTRVEAEDGRVRAARTTGLDRPARRAVFLEGLTDFHAHLADAFLAGRRIPRDLAAAVSPRTGVKHLLLALASPARVQAASARRLRALARAGVAHVVEFREQGVKGIRLARAAARVARFPNLVVLGRPAVPGVARERARVLAAADGIGLSGLTDVGLDEARAVARAARAAGTPFTIHVSEGAREPMDDVLDLRPDLLVHACAATGADLEAVAHRRVPLVFCPTSNRHFRLRPPLEKAERLGIPWFLGTDNAMLGSPGPLAEARLARRLAPSLPDASLLRALTTTPKKVLKRFAPLERRARPRRLIVLPTDAAGHVRWGARERILTW